jgi:hypothetical protein
MIFQLYAVVVATVVINKYLAFSRHIERLVIAPLDTGLIQTLLQNLLGHEPFRRYAVRDARNVVRYLELDKTHWRFEKS